MPGRVSHWVGQAKMWICTELFIQWSLPAQAPCTLIHPALMFKRFLFLNTAFVLHSGWQTCRQIDSSETLAASSHALILVLSTVELQRLWHTFYKSFLLSLHLAIPSHSHIECFSRSQPLYSWFSNIMSQICTAQFLKLDKKLQKLNCYILYFIYTSSSYCWKKEITRSFSQRIINIFKTCVSIQFINLLSADQTLLL